MKSVDVVVVGGGFAGVTAARELSQAGHSVVLLEGRDRLGGRTWYRKFEGREQHVEIGGTWVKPSRQRYVEAELQRYGIGTVPSPEAEDFRWVLDGKVHHKNFPLPMGQWGDFERAIARIDADAARLRFYEEPLGQAGLEDLDVPFSDYLDGLNVAAAIKEFLSSWTVFYFGAYAQDLSALHVLSYVTGLGSAIDWYLLTDKIAGGTKTLIEAIIDDCNAEVHLETPVQSITQTGARVQVTTRYGEVYDARSVVVTAPINTWNNIEFQPPLQGSHAAMAAEKHAGRAVKVFALVRGLDKNIFGTGLSTRLKWISTQFTTEEGQYLCGFGMPEDLDPHDVQGITDAIHEFAPEAEVLATDSHDWNRDEFSEGTWMAYAPGQIMKHSHGIQESHGRVAFANSDLASAWAGWFDGAIESAFRASTTVAQWLETDHENAAGAAAEING
jgi:monoamine oxidase